MPRPLDFTKFILNINQCPVNFDLAGPGDKPVLLNLCIKTLKQWNVKIDGDFIKNQEQLLQKQIENKLIICAYLNSEVIGFTSAINFMISSCLSMDRLHITNTVIQTDYRKKGIADMLRKIIIEYAVSNNYRLLTTNHHKTNFIMQNLSEKYDFKVFTEIELMPVDADSISYKLELLK